VAQEFSEDLLPLSPLPQPPATQQGALPSAALLLLLLPHRVPQADLRSAMLLLLLLPPHRAPQAGLRSAVLLLLPPHRAPQAGLRSGHLLEIVWLPRLAQHVPPIPSTPLWFLVTLLSLLRAVSYLATWAAAVVRHGRALRSAC
jgi:hypothetical protein